MKLIVGLGNPGNEYVKTRHNVGFMAIDKISDKLNIPINRSDFKGLYGKGQVNGETIYLLKPQTYMNLSGESVQAIASYFKIDLDDIIVIHDDLDLPIGKLRLRKKGNSGGQNGVKNIIQHLNSNEFKRVKIGIGKDKNIPVVDYVLGKINDEQLTSIEKACDAVLTILDNDFEYAMNKFN